ncbi:hypothetical protein ACHAXA_003611 [Cyclostephanos tholiformis]|uniref:Uncharacterized protein n=1 Tax=Cyclostephanos tholiformis TaxID=382380 RepID=A0ABD3SPM2_9STRA
MVRPDEDDHPHTHNTRIAYTIGSIISLSKIMTPTPKVTALLLGLLAASPTCDSFALAPGPRLLQQQRRRVVSVGLSLNRHDEDASIADGWRKASGAAASFLTGMGIMVQLALADPTAAVAPIDSGIVANAQSSSILLSIGAPSFGGGASFETLDFSLPSYDAATSGGDITKSSSSPAPSAAASKIDDSAAKAAAKEEREASRRAEADAREAQKKADEAAAKDAAEKAAAKEAAKEERKAAEREKQRLAVERQKAAAAQTIDVPSPSPKIDVTVVPATPKVVDAVSPGPGVSLPEFRIPDAPKVDVPSFTMPKVDMPKVDMPKVDMPSFTMPKVDVPDVPKFALPKVDLPAAPKYDLDVPKFDMPSRVPAVVDENLEPQEVRDARAAEKNAAFKEAKDEARAAERAAKAAQERAQNAKKAFKDAKGEACKTRPGGKLLCLRGFGIGY